MTKRPESRGRTLMRQYPSTTKWLVFISVLSTANLLFDVLTH